VVISDQLWRTRFKGDPQIIGKVQRLNNVPHTIVGVAPPGFYGTFVGWAMQFWVPANWGCGWPWARMRRTCFVSCFREVCG